MSDLKLFLDRDWCDKQSRLTNLPILPYARPFLRGTEDDTSYTFYREEVFRQMESEPMFQSVQDIAEAEAILMPIDWSRAARFAPHVEAHYRRLAEQAGLPLIVTHFSDDDADVPGDDIIVIRNSKVRSALRRNEIICPPAVRDIRTEGEFPILDRPAEPTVGFVGQIQKRTDLSLKRLLIPYGRRDRLYSLLSISDPRFYRKCSGHYLRDRTMDTLQSTVGIRCSFIRRPFYGRAPEVQTVRDHAALRHEFVDNLENNLYLLTVRGLGNYSFRFYEILAGGRIPLFVDTDCPLPLANEIDYGAFCLFVDAADLKQIGARLLGFHRAASPQQVRDMQEKALRTFQEKLRFDVFCRRLFRETLPAILHRKTLSSVETA
ncbi:MAG: hypothetical protein RIG67_31160 [Rhodospirillales bacterium]